MSYKKLLLFFLFFFPFKGFASEKISVGNISAASAKVFYKNTPNIFVIIEVYLDEDFTIPYPRYRSKTLRHDTTTLTLDAAKTYWIKADLYEQDRFKKSLPPVSFRTHNPIRNFKNLSFFPNYNSVLLLADSALKYEVVLTDKEHRVIHRVSFLDSVLIGGLNEGKKYQIRYRPKTKTETFVWKTKTFLTKKRIFPSGETLFKNLEVNQKQDTINLHLLDTSSFDALLQMAKGASRKILFLGIQKTDSLGVISFEIDSLVQQFFDHIKPLRDRITFSSFFEINTVSKNHEWLKKCENPLSKTCPFIFIPENSDSNITDTLKTKSGNIAVYDTKLKLNFNRNTALVDEILNKYIDSLGLDEVIINQPEATFSAPDGIKDFSIIGAWFWKNSDIHAKKIANSNIAAHRWGFDSLFFLGKWDGFIAKSLSQNISQFDPQRTPNIIKQWFEKYQGRFILEINKEDSPFIIQLKNIFSGNISFSPEKKHCDLIFGRYNSKIIWVEYRFSNSSTMFFINATEEIFENIEIEWTRKTLSIKKFEPFSVQRFDVLDKK